MRRRGTDAGACPPPASSSTEPWEIARSSNSSWAVRCPAWRSELHGDVPLDPDVELLVARLASSCLSPFAARGVHAHQLRPKLGNARADCAQATPSRICPLVIVRGGKMFVHIPPKSRLFDQPLFGCRNSEQGSSMHRLRTLLRTLHIVVAEGSPPLPDFEARLCVDDFCHGLFEDRGPLPWFTMCSCSGTPSIAALGWNSGAAFGGSPRDPDLSTWEAVLAHRHKAFADNDKRWACRSPVAAWRGSISDSHVTNADWSEHRTLRRIPWSDARWREQGRLALVGAKCADPQLFDIYVAGVHGRVDAESFARCLRELDDQRSVPTSVLAARYKYAIHVEGSGGWADRYKHLLLSGAVVLKQEAGVREWFEPLLEPWQHYVPVSSTLHNLSAAVRWAREHDAQARAIAARAAALMQRLLAPQVLVRYQTLLFRGYAALYNGSAQSAGPRPSEAAAASSSTQAERAASPAPPASHRRYFWSLHPPLDGGGRSIVTTAQFSCRLGKQPRATEQDAAPFVGVDCAWVDTGTAARRHRMSEIAQLHGHSGGAEPGC